MNDWAHDLVRRMCDQVDETEAALFKAGKRSEGERLLRTLPDGAEHDGMTGLKVVWGDFFTFLGVAIVTGLVPPDAW